MANRAFYRLFRTGPETTQGRPLKDLGGKEWDIPALDGLLSKMLKAGEVFEDYEVNADVPGLGPRAMLLNARKVQPTREGNPLILLAMEDVTDSPSGGNGG
jgi:two-component system, chemotaxis family, CheB/CheR fusion protein